MVDLHAEVLALIQATREETPHGRKCNAVDIHTGVPYDGTALGFVNGYACTCDWQARFEAELARRLATAIRTAIAKTVLIPTPVPYAWEQPIYEAALAAAREASHED